jgi:PilZ domain
MGALHVHGVTINVSEHGVYLFAATNLSVGTEVEIEYRASGRQESVCACGIVRRRAVFLYGIEFLNNDAAAIGERTQVWEELA